MRFDPIDHEPEAMGYRDYAPGKLPAHPDNDDYMAGWRDAETFEALPRD